VTPAVLAVDAGQTEIRAALAGDGRGPRTATAPGVLRMGHRVGPEQVGAALLAAVAALGPLPAPLTSAGVGLSGFEAAEDELQHVGELLCRELAVERLAIASDGLTSLLGALGDRDGAVGRAGLDAALRHADGRGGSEALLRAAERRYAPMPELSKRIDASPAPISAIAAFAHDVARAAAAGDAHAHAIFEEAAHELASTACAALGRLFEPGEPAIVSYAGNVFRAGALVVEPFIRSVSERRPGTQVVPPDGDALAGAALLAALARELRPEPGILWTAR
jgi:N-acetylglucosamine kinase-like BadF-type ATPase